MSHVFRSKRLLTVEARASHVVKLFKSDNNHPIIWREYVEGDIQNHPEVGRYKTVCQPYSVSVRSESKIFDTDKEGCLPVRSHSRDPPKLLLLVWHHGSNPNRRSRAWKPTIRHSRPCDHCCKSRPISPVITALMPGSGRACTQDVRDR